MKALENYLRMHRKRAGLTQAEVAYLLGVLSGSKVSRYERFTRRPTLETALAFELILATPVRDLFEGVREEVEHEVQKRARRLHRRLVKQHGHHRKLALVDRILASSIEDVTYIPPR